MQEVLFRHAAVTEVSVIGRADPEWGEAVVACVVVDDASVGAQELDDFCRESMAGFNRPKAYHFLQSLRNSNSKVLKTHLRTTYTAPTQMPAVAAKSPATPKDRT